jgi:hypothetical protein
MANNRNPTFAGKYQGKKFLRSPKGPQIARLTKLWVSTDTSDEDPEYRVWEAKYQEYYQHLEELAERKREKKEEERDEIITIADIAHTKLQQAVDGRGPTNFRKTLGHAFVLERLRRRVEEIGDEEEEEDSEEEEEEEGEKEEEEYMWHGRA